MPPGPGSEKPISKMVVPFWMINPKDTFMSQGTLTTRETTRGGGAGTGTGSGTTTWHCQLVRGGNPPRFGPFFCEMFFGV